MMIDFQSLNISKSISFIINSGFLIKEIFYKYKKSLVSVCVLMAEKIISLILILLCESYTAKGLSVVDYGVLQYSFNLILLFSSIGMVLSGDVLIPLLIKYKRINASIITSSILIRFSFCLAVCSFVLMYAYLFVDEDLIKRLLFVFSVIILINEPVNAITTYYQARVNIGPIVRIRVCGVIVRLILTLSVYYVFNSNSAFYYAYSRVGSLVFSSLAIIILFKEIDFEMPRMKVTLSLLCRGIKFFPVVVLAFFFSKIDRVFIQHIFGSQSVALYSIAIQLIEQLILVISIIIVSFSPVVFFSKRLSKSKVIMFLVLLLMISFFCIAVSYLFSGIFIRNLFGDKYMESVEISKGLSFSLLFITIDMFFTQLFIRLKMYNVLVLKWIAGIVILFFSYLLVMDYGLSYIWVAQVSSYFTMSLISFSFFVFNGNVKRGVLWSCYEK